MKTELMIDIETLSRASNAVILSIGWCHFNLPPQDFSPSGVSINVLPLSCVERGMQIEQDTVLWWLHPGRVTALRECVQNAVELPEALRALEDAVDEWEELNGVWARSPRFDFGILTHAYEVCEMRAPWHFRQERCARTIVAELGAPCGYPKAPPRDTLLHTADGDAIYQAEALYKMFSALEGERRKANAVW
jgi:hypothetical protein